MTVQHLLVALMNNGVIRPSDHQEMTDKLGPYVNEDVRPGLVCDDEKAVSAIGVFAGFQCVNLGPYTTTRIALLAIRTATSGRIALVRAHQAKASELADDF